jgi:hypothetical protein
VHRELKQAIDGILIPIMSNSTFTIDTRLCGGDGVNEDMYGHTSESAWVIDGATGLTDKQFSNQKSDELWFVNRISDRLSARMSHDHSLSDIVR